MTRPAALASAAAAALHGADPMLVSDIPMSHPALGAAVRELAVAVGVAVPLPYALQLPAPPDRDTIADLIGIDPREGFLPYSHWEADDEERDYERRREGYARDSFCW